MAENATALTHVSEALGPYMAQFISSCYETSPHRILFFWISGSIFALIAVGLSFQHYREVQARPPSLQRMYYTNVMVFAPILGVCAAISLFSPRNYMMLKMFQELTEAFALAAFGNVLFLLCASEAWNQDFEGATAGEKMLNGLNAQGPAPHFAVPPFGCCFASCLKPGHLLKPWHLLLSRNFVRGYALAVIIGSVLSLWCALSMGTEGAIKVHGMISTVTKLSAFVCIYGLFILYKASHHLLEEWHPTAKFISLKIVVVLMAWQDLVIKKLIKHFDPVETPCLKVEGVSGELGHELQQSMREHFLAMYLVTLESILVAYLVRNAFPAKELKPMNAQIHGMLLDIDLTNMEEKSRRSILNDDDSGYSRTEEEEESSKE